MKGLGRLTVFDLLAYSSGNLLPFILRPEPMWTEIPCLLAPQTNLEDPSSLPSFEVEIEIGPFPSPVFRSISPIVLSVHSHNAFKGSPHTSLIVSFDNEAFLSRHVRYIEIGSAQAFFSSDKCGTLLLAFESENKRTWHLRMLLRLFLRVDIYSPNLLVHSSVRTTELDL